MRRIVSARSFGIPLNGRGKFCNAVLVLFADIARSNQFSEKSDGQHLKSNDEAAERIDQQRPGSNRPKAMHPKACQHPAYRKVREASRTEQEGGKTDPTQQMKRTLSENGEENHGKEIQETLNKPMKPVLRSPVAPGMMFDGNLRDAVAARVGHHGNEAVQLPVQRQLLDHLGAKTLEPAVVVAQL